MKKFYYLLIFIFLFLPISVFAEEILDFQVNIKVLKNSDIIVQEKIIYNFGNEQRHGIYRDIPYKYSARGGNYKLDIKVLNITDENNNNLNYNINKNNNYLNIKIGDADKYVSGRKIYIINYQINGAINYFKDYDELYWNITGNDWNVNINNIKAEIIMPDDISNSDIKAECFTGYQGSKDSACDKNIETNSIYFQAKNFLAKQGLSVVIGWPKGITAEPSFFIKLYKKIKDNLILLLPVLVLIFLYNYWRRHGKDPLGAGTIMPEYEPPANILPAEAGVVIDEKMDTRDLTATIIDLANRGYLKIKQEDKKALGFSIGKDWQLLLTEKSIANLSGFEKKLINILFDNDREVFLSKIKKNNKLAQEIKDIKNSIYDKVVEKGWFEKNPNKIRATFSGIGLGIIFLVGFFIEALVGGAFSALFIISIIISAILFIIFAQFMPKKTKAGAEIKEKLQGFKMFLSATEKDRVKFHFSPQAHPEKFADYLAWAIIFKVEKEWANVFNGIDMPAPDWYVGIWTGNYTAWVMINFLSSFGSSFNKTLTSAGAGAARGASGFGGGGFSGGGFGGGGGGSW